MPIERFYLPTLPTSSPPAEVTLSGEEFHHLRVMRLSLGDEVELVNGFGTLAKGSLTALTSSSATVSLSHIHSVSPPSPRLIVAQALPRFSHLEWLVEKGVELGASEFWLFPGKRSEKVGLSPQQQKRLHALLVSALKQSGALFLPPLLLKPSIAEWGPLPDADLFFGDLSPAAPLLSLPKKESGIIVIGPEKGFADEEVRLLTARGQGVRLHSNTLRTETAALAALSQWYYLRGLSRQSSLPS